jgi:O-antigen ligase
MTSTVLERPGREAPAPHSQAIERAAEQPSSLTAISLFILVFSLIFEDAKIGGVEPSTIAGVLFVFASLLQPSLFFKKPRGPLIPYALFTLFTILSVLLLPINFPAESARRASQYTYLLGMAWVLSNLMLNKRLMLVALSSLAASTVVLATLQITGIAAAPWGQGVGERITAFGFHPNQLSFNFSLGVVALLGISGYNDEKKRLPLWLLLPLMGIVTFALVQTGSRGGLIALAVGILAYCLQPGNPRQRATAIFVAFVGLFMVVFMVTQSASTMERINATVEDGNMSRRDIVYPIALDLFQERPLFGWGVAANTLELGNRFQEPGTPNKDTHNAILYVLTGCGIIGSLPFFIGLGQSVRWAWKARRTPLGITPFALVFCVLAAAMGVTLIQAKIFWLVMAFCVASVPLVDRQPRRARVGRLS